MRDWHAAAQGGGAGSMALLSVLYADGDLVVIDKPAGLLVHRSGLTGVQTCALQLLRDQLGRLVYPVHRLDRPVAGPLLFALSSEMARLLCLAFAEHRVVKRYHAIVRGYTDCEGVVDHPLAEEPGAPRQPAVTRYRRLATAELLAPVPPHATARYSLVEAEPVTGRMHQLRRHLKHLAHPVVGDTQYGDGRHNRFFRENLGVGGLLLAARRLEFAHPRTGAWLRIEAALPPDLQAACTLLGWR